MAKISVSIGETIGNVSLPELKKFESLRLDTAIVELDSKEMGVTVKDSNDLDAFFKQAREKLFEQAKLLAEEASKYIKDRNKTFSK